MTQPKRDNFFLFSCAAAALFIIGHLTAAILLCRERLFLDTAYYFFRVVSSESFRVEHQRIILVLSQVLLWLGVKAHQPLHTLMVLYSVTPIVYTGILLFISLYYFRSAAAAWMLIACNVCGTYFLYYSPMYEVCYAIVTFGFLWFLTVRGYHQTMVQMLIYMSLLAICLLGYPVIAMGCVALLSYMWLFEDKLPKRLLICYAIVFAIWLLIKTFWISDYERAHVRINADEKKMHDVLTQVFSLGYFAQMGVFAIIRYFIVVFAVSYVTISTIRLRQYAKAAWASCWFVFLMVFMNLKAGGDGLIPTIHNERSFLIMVPICLAPLLYFSLHHMKKTMAYIILAVLFTDCCFESVRTWEHGAYYRDRITQMSALAHDGLTHGCTKLASPVASLPKALNEWSTGIEVMIHSTDQGHSVAWVDKEVYDSTNVYIPLDNKHVLLSMNIDPLSEQQLNPRYFHMDSSAYCLETERK
ncbi:MAG: hypothetical protein JST90_04445 [Bacteroidetes bacterium]|nr:hypothetical protein [Bacteroidota bacterium]